MSTPIIDIRRPGPCGPRAAADARTASNGRLVVLRRLGGSASGSDAETADPMRVESTLGAVQRPGLELALEVGLHIEEL